MARFLLTLQASVDTSAGNDPVINVFIDGLNVASSTAITAITGVGSDILAFTLDFDDSVNPYPSSMFFRFDPGSGDPGDILTIQAVKINGQSVDISSNLSADTLSQGQSANITSTANLDHLFGQAEPTPADLGTPTQTGTPAGEQINGTDGQDVIDGSGGDDRLRGVGDDDSINGGTGDDTIFGEDGNDIIIGGSGNDRIYGNAGDDLLHGQDENDFLFGGSGNDLLNGGNGMDTLIAHDGDDVLYGGADADRLIGVSGSNSMYGDDGNDILLGGRNNDTMSGGADNDQINGGLGNDIINGDGGSDFIMGGLGNDVADGGTEDDLIFGDLGDDILSGGEHNDQIYGDAGSDTLNGDGGFDLLVGGAGADTLNGGIGNDVLRGNGIDSRTVSSIIRNNPGVVFSEETNSFYQYVNTASTWTAANATAQATLLNGASGHLVSISTLAENVFVTSLLDVGATAWTSGSDDGGGSIWSWNGGSENATQFSTGATAVNNLYENWLGGEPNLTNAFVSIRESDGSWLDEAGTNTFHYVIEWEAGSMDGDTAIDVLNGGDNDDHLYGYNGNDTLNGGNNNDLLFGGNGDDNLNGDGGDDTIDGDTGDDIINGGNGNDTLFGGIGDDTIDGQDNNDTIYGDNADSVTVLEAGRTTVTQASATDFYSVSFSETIINPVIKMFAEDVTGDPFTIRVRNISNTGFEFQLDEFDYQDGATALETLSWIAVASGSHTLANGIQIEAGFTTAVNETDTAVSFNSSFTNPVVFSQLSSDNDLTAAALRNDNVTGTGFDVNMLEEEANDGLHVSETVGWIAMEEGGSVATGMLVSTIGSLITDATTTENFGGSFASNPAFIADMQTTNGGDTAMAVSGNVTGAQADVVRDEETSADTETAHGGAESVSYVALNEGIYTASSTVINGSDILRGGIGDDLIYADSSVDTNIAAPSTSNLLETLITSDSPEAYWNLNETAGTIADNQGSLGASVDGTIVGGATLNAGALYTNGGTSIDFDGVNDGIRIPDSIGINTGTYAERTVELVFDADDVSALAGRQVLWEEGGTVNGLTIYIDTGTLYVTGEDDGDWVDANISAAISAGTTYHVAMVFDQPNNNFEGFLNGTSMGSVTVNNAVFPSHGGDIGIGYAPDGLQFHDGEDGSGGYFFDGRISDVALYNTALSASDIQDRADAIAGNSITEDPIDDILYGGDGFDQLFGGDGGRDVFVFESGIAFNDIDEINGFDVAEQDALDISDILVGYVDGVSDINDFVNVTTAGSGTDSLIGVDANGGGSFTDIAQINGVINIDADYLLANNSLIPV